MDDFKARDVQFFTNFKKVKFKSYNIKNCSLSQKEMIKIIDGYRFKPFNDRTAYLEVYTSNKIEGNTLTKGQTKAVLEGIAQDADLRSQTEVIQLNRAIRDNFSIRDDLSIEFILDIHKDITFNTLENNTWEGHFRSEQVYISNSSIVPPSADKVSQELRHAVDMFNSSEKELVDILKFKLDFVRIHAFMDGNGRLSRLLMNGLLTAKGYPRIIIRNQDKGFYYDAIESSLRVGRYDAWLKFMLTYMKFMCELEDMFLGDIE
ncbi:Fic family protein [Clostridium frigidicarnis]|uniref:Fic/DOC family protein n=1 Tax=Clostridium frigidicarnis TaxID=84698 RepID=A0A1I1AYP4_9CLOT|nr:Fic family protein [Clostridium frigidicarnis]SFB42526.1 Fic/DOC family protein [Clostridium frigidicarnis]